MKPNTNTPQTHGKWWISHKFEKFQVIIIIDIDNDDDSQILTMKIKLI